MKLLSSSAYHCLRTSGFLKLPSERTLRDYTHHYRSSTGFQNEVDAMLRKEVGSEEWKNYMVLLIDEIKVKENLVYNKYENRVVGFVELDDIEHALSQLEEHSESYYASCGYPSVDPDGQRTFHWLEVPVRTFSDSRCDW